MGILDSIGSAIGNAADWVFTGGDSVIAGPNPGFASGTTLGQNVYNFNYSIFPSDLGMDDNGHYMVININVPTQGIKTNGLALGTPAGAFTNLFTPANQVSKMDVLRFGQNVTGGLQSPLLSIPQNTTRIQESIALFMPTPLVWNDQNVYEEVSLTALAGRVGIGTVSVISGIVNTITGGIANDLLAAARPLATGAGQVIGTAASVMGNPINPAVEVLFANKAQRQFVFELLCAPRNEVESISLKKIIKTLRFHGSPELNPRTAGLTWIPPATFDITFFNKGAENTHILRINTVVLERFETDFAPTGIYSTFRNGHPVAVRISMAFRELEVIHKQRVLQGF